MKLLLLCLVALCCTQATHQANSQPSHASSQTSLKANATATARKAFGYESPIVDPDMVIAYRHRFARLPSGVLPLNDGAMVKLWKTRLRRFAAEALRTLYASNGMLDVPDAVMIWAMTRAFQPRQVLEIGAGYSSYIFNKAMSACRDRGGGCRRHVAIEPYRSKVLAHLANRVHVIATPLQDVPLSTFTTLRRNDILFIDSSHVMRPYGDVVYEFLFILPLLQPGVIVHVHDIFLPDDYPEQWMQEQRSYTEQWLLAAFLHGNADWKVLWSSHFMGSRHGKLVGEDMQGGTSFWMQKVR